MNYELNKTMHHTFFSIMEYTIADRLMWHFMQGRCFKVLREECAEWDISQLRKSI